MRFTTLNQLKVAVREASNNVPSIKQIPTVTRHFQPASKHKYWSKVAKKNKLNLLIDYINREYTDTKLKTEYCLKLTLLLNNGDLNNNECVEFDYVNNKIIKLNFSIDTLDLK